ncbi:FecR family protein [Pedobacter xixiisoli]|uniref:FecR family protein n=1 Tax=Pedobacter xixiisoli TaxID=1476464 RepID=A0A285ZQT8_9SPHI|nr:FecR family protein [Pedobacter xixiisoli]SOD12017.1 FecR family protein [Pedobacter xixiisoli]
MKLTEPIKQAIHRLFTARSKREDFKIINNWYQSNEEETLLVEDSMEVVKNNIRRKIDSKTPKNNLRLYSKRIMSAAAVVAIVGVGISYFKTGKSDHIIYDGPKLSVLAPTINSLNSSLKIDGKVKYADNKLIAARSANAEIFSITLEDGSKVWINAASSLEKLNFSATERRVKLIGEAFFEVAKDSTRPFFVETAQQTIRVLGTKFNLKSYPNQKETLTLVEGKVSTRSQKDKEAILIAGESIILDKGEIVPEAFKENNLLWKEQVFAFEDETLAEILDKVSKWYNVTTSNVPTSNKHISGKIGANASIYEVLNMLSLVSNEQIVLEKNVVVVK